MAGGRAAAPQLLPASPRWLERHGTFHNTGSVFLSTLMAPSEKFVHLHLQGFYMVGNYLLSLFDIRAFQAERGKAARRPGVWPPAPVQIPQPSPLPLAFEIKPTLSLSQCSTQVPL